MRRFRRGIALTLVLFLAQLTLVGSGYTCDRSMEDGASEMAGMAGMAGMAAPVSSATPHDGAPAPPADPCTLPWAPAGCTLMIPCAPHALSAHVAPTLPPSPADHRPPPSDDSAPASLIIPPDPPPPRA